jgi:hypothetical protein
MHNIHECLKQTNRSLIAFYWSNNEIDHVHYYEIISTVDIYSLTLKYISVKEKKQYSRF